MLTRDKKDPIHSYPHMYIVTNIIAHIYIWVEKHTHICTFMCPESHICPLMFACIWLQIIFALVHAPYGSSYVYFYVWWYIHLYLPYMMHEQAARKLDNCVPKPLKGFNG